ncbi:MULTISPECIES: DUF4440 domain-containing protein [Rhodococcus]|uniref:DUF4440 domain-containing protein n=1 Tax=Rhodococcus cerastii TaxID=908616 RepID=A0ABU4D739_9NOCA|nr:MULTISPECIES: DUF4440 domain-containing protein [Rhodococcus]MDV6305119.1 DUF4440 domain-containing protein [Rhodococcus cerastii]MDV8057414.1 DUF4440 domain-containing protein [Rhodococcus sp. IEGM 1343]
MWILDAASEPDYDGSPELVLAELERREPIFHRREFGTTREDFDRLTDANFWETGASGRRYSREHVWAVLAQRYASDPTGRHDSDWTASEFELREIAPNAYLLTYSLEQHNRFTRRMTLWQRREGDWRILYHQGTPVAGSVADTTPH